MNNKRDLNGQELHALELKLGIGTSFVKAASSEDFTTEDGLESKHFANPADRLYPTHTKEATTRSIVYFFGEGQDSVYPEAEVQNRLYKAARFWGVSDDYYIVKKASTPSYAPPATTVYAHGDKLPISTEEQILKSASALVSQRGSLHYTERAEVASKILKAASTAECDIDVTTPDFQAVQVMSGVLLKSASVAADNLERRATAFDRLGLGADIYKTAAKQVRAGASNDTVDELCELIDTFEHFHKVARTVKGLGPIEDAFFDCLKPDVSVSLANGSDMLMSTVKSASLSPFYAVDPSAVLDVTDSKGKLDLSKAATYLEKLPKIDCNLFEEAVKQCLK